jgi:putative SOS response-associated peptidase YedK
MSFNIGPLRYVPVLFKTEEGELVITPMQWGVTWIGSNLIINARFEEVAEKPVFRHQI